jgi:hypothetical protein
VPQGPAPKADIKNAPERDHLTMSQETPVIIATRYAVSASAAKIKIVSYSNILLILWYVKIYLLTNPKHSTYIIRHSPDSWFVGHKFFTEAALVPRCFLVTLCNHD